MGAKQKAKDITYRMIAVIIASAMGTIGAGAILGVEAWKAAALASILGVAVVAETLSRNFLDDGKLSESEINESFQSQAAKPEEK